MSEDLPRECPEFLVCPITGDLMRDPVATVDGQTYDRPAIARWLNDHNTSPLTGLPLPSKQLTTNFALRDALCYLWTTQANYRTAQAECDSLRAECDSLRADARADAQATHGDAQRVAVDYSSAFQAGCEAWGVGVARSQPGLICDARVVSDLRAVWCAARGAQQYAEGGAWTALCKTHAGQMRAAHEAHAAAKQEILDAHAKATRALLSAHATELGALRETQTAEMRAAREEMRQVGETVHTQIMKTLEATHRREIETLRAQLSNAGTARLAGQTEPAESRATRAETQAELAETRATLAKTQAELAETRATLAETRATLVTTQAKLAETQVQLRYMGS